jgi:hypothetical protein
MVAQEPNFSILHLDKKPASPKQETPKTEKEEDRLWQLAKDPRTYWYTEESLPEVYESSGTLYPVGYNLAGRLDRTGSANNERPWLHTGGLDRCGPEVNVKRMLWIPPNTKIKIWNEARTLVGGQRNGLDYTLHVGKFPVGTVSAEFIYDGVRMFEARSRTKTEDGWEFDQQEWGEKPKGYVAVNSCTKCHEDIGKHSFALDGVRDWYGTVRGLEPNGPIHWHPWDARGVTGAGRKPVIREDVKQLVEFVSAAVGRRSK